MKIELLREYRYAHQGVNIVTYQPGLCDIPEVVAKAAIHDGAAKQIQERVEPKAEPEETPEPDYPPRPQRGKRRG